MEAVYQSLVSVEPLTFVCAICNLLVQMLIVKKFFLEQIEAVLDKRREAADAQIADAEAAKAQAEAEKADYEAKIADAKGEASQIVAKAQKTANAQSEAIVAEARAEASQIRAKAAQDIDREREGMLDDLKGEIGGMAVDIASAVVEREINEKDHQALIDDFIENVGKAS